MKTRRHIRFGALVPILLMLSGAALLCYTGWEYWSMYSGQRQLESKWNEQQHAIKLHTATTADDSLTRLSIPKINFDAVVVEGSSHHALLLGPGHLKDTPAPGEIGNSVISGHRDTFFRNIHELKKGDTLTVQRDGKVYSYTVTGKEIVGPSDTWVLKPSSQSELTLITCYPTYYIGPAPKRLVVFSKLSDSQADANLTTTDIPKKAAAAAR